MRLAGHHARPDRGYLTKHGKRLTAAGSTPTPHHCPPPASSSVHLAQFGGPCRASRVRGAFAVRPGPPTRPKPVAERAQRPSSKPTVSRTESKISPPSAISANEAKATNGSFAWITRSAQNGTDHGDQAVGSGQAGLRPEGETCQRRRARTRRSRAPPGPSAALDLDGAGLHTRCPTSVGHLRRPAW